METEITSNIWPDGMALRDTFRGQHKDGIWQVAWSPDGATLASGSSDGMLCLWDLESGRHLHNLKGHIYWVMSLAWSPNGKTLASGSSEHVVRLWDPYTGKSIRTISGHSGDVYSVSWSPDGTLLVSGSYDNTIRVWDPNTGQPIKKLIGPGTSKSSLVESVIWSPDGAILVSGSYNGPICLWNLNDGKIIQKIGGYDIQASRVMWFADNVLLASDNKDKTIKIWDPYTAQHLNILEGHTERITDLSISCDRRLLASKSLDGEVRIWRTDTWDLVTKLGKMVTQREFNPSWFGGLAFHPASQILARATVDEDEVIIQVWDVDVDTLLGNTPIPPSVHYTNAKVVLLGDSGVGKSGLSLALTGQPFIPTESTHGRHIHVFENQEIKIDDKAKEIRETLLWDLAGQPDYRLIHQLHLNEVTVALLVFDHSSEDDIFAGIRYWDRALRLAQQANENAAHPLKKLLVAARLDRSARNVSCNRMEELQTQLGFVNYFQTSAKEGWEIKELAQAIREAISWNSLPKVTSTELFYQIKQFLINIKQTEELLCNKDELYYLFLQSSDISQEAGELRSQFETCLGHIASAGLIRVLSFGDFILLQPELLDAYASALLIAVKNDASSLGNILEDRVKRGDFPISKDERIPNKAQEKLLLIAMIEEMLSQDIVLREQGDLIFPSQIVHEYPNLSDPEGRSLIFTFEGPGLSIYTRLVVRLSNSGFFKKKNIWKNAVTYTARTEGLYGLFLNIKREEHNELTVFFDKAASEETRFLFESYIQEYLRQHSLPGSMRFQRFFTCPNCSDAFTDRQVKSRRERGFDWIQCSICETKVSLLNREERYTSVPLSQVADIDHVANSQRDRETGQLTLDGKIATSDFDVFLCHNEEDNSSVRKIGEQLKEFSILPWLDEWELRPGLPWQRTLESQIGCIKSVAVFVGEEGIGPWQREEIDAFLREFTKRGCPVIPVFLPGAPKEPKLPPFLENRTWVDFRKQGSDPIKRLIWGITGKRHVT